jgi:hypothetical protein
MYKACPYNKLMLKFSLLHCESCLHNMIDLMMGRSTDTPAECEM